MGVAKRPRCRDYDEKGFCLRGDHCKFDHGNDAVVLEDGAPPPNTSVPPPYLPGGFPPPDPYVPGAAPGAASAVLPPLHLPPPGYAGGQSRKRSYGDTDSTSYPPAKQRFDYNRLGGRGARGGRGAGRGGGPLSARNVPIPPNATSELLVRGIPPNLNTIAHMNNHFARFGTLQNVQVHYEGDQSLAVVSFATPLEANAAMTSPDAVLGNRFIKMHYHRSERTGKPRTPVKDRLGETVSDETAQGGTITKTIVNQDAIKSSSPEESEALKENQKAVVSVVSPFELLERCFFNASFVIGNCCNKEEPGGP